MSGTPCAKCSGTGLVARQGEDADRDMHPILSQHQTVCDACGGGGVLSAAQSRAVQQAAAKAAEG